MATCSVKDLIDKACSSKFTCISDERTFRGLLLQLLCEFNQSGTSGIEKFDSGLLPIQLGQFTWTVNHGLGGTPPMVRAVLVCTANDAVSSLLPGDEMLLEDINIGGTVAFSVVSNATQIVVGSSQAMLGNEGLFGNVRRGGNGQTVFDHFFNFAIRIYAWR